MGDVRVGHEQILVADGRLAPAAGRAAVDGDEFSEDVALTDDQPRVLAAVLEVLGWETDRGEGKELGAITNRGVAVDDRRRADPAIAAEDHLRSDHRVGADDGA